MLTVQNGGLVSVGMSAGQSIIRRCVIAENHTINNKKQHWNNGMGCDKYPSVFFQTLDRSGPLGYSPSVTGRRTDPFFMENAGEKTPRRKQCVCQPLKAPHE